MTQPCAVGVDLGGQSVRVGLVRADGTVIERWRTPITRDSEPDTLIQTLRRHVDVAFEAAESHAVSPVGVGVAMPGYLNETRERLAFSANLPALSGTDFPRKLAAALPCNVRFDADCNAATLAEWRYGAGRGVSPLIVATIGTGIGAGVITDGRIVRLRNHIAGSLGHVIVDARGVKCACGATGCVEAYASGRAMERAAAEAADRHPSSLLAELRRERGRLTGVECGEAVRSGDPAANSVVERCGWWLGAGIATWCAIFAPQQVVIGGGIAALGEPFLDAARRGLREVGQPHTTRNVEVVAAELGGDAGLIGVGSIALDSPSDLE